MENGSAPLPRAVGHPRPGPTANERERCTGDQLLMSGRHRKDEDELPQRIPGLAWQQLVEPWRSSSRDAAYASEPWKPGEDTLLTLARVRDGLNRM